MSVFRTDLTVVLGVGTLAGRLEAGTPSLSVPYLTHAYTMHKFIVWCNTVEDRARMLLMRREYYVLIPCTPS